ncbi:MAG: Fic family protein [Flavobacteriaceae bacterium]|jgi:Fic family protein|nr:Fic family protein [Flavobacteriaceae bacterium]
MSNYKIFNTEQQKKAEFILENKYSELFALNSKETKDLAVVWCYYSGKIEGNTYSFVETESLLKDDITSIKRYEDAKMLKNLYNAFISELEYIKNGNIETIEEKTIFRIHKLITQELVSTEDSGFYRNRQVRISGTHYLPPSDKHEIQSLMNQIFVKQNEFSNPLELAVFLHGNIAKMQPFIDGNKRTSRFVESIVLMNNNLVPVYSINEEDIQKYRKAIISFYETHDYNLYADYFLTRQIERINEISLTGEEIFDLNTNQKKKSNFRRTYFI